MSPNSDQPKSFKAARLVEINKPFEILDVEFPTPSRGEIVVKVLACGVCHSDDVVVQGHMGPHDKKLPFTPGHEIVGDVFSVGEGETRFKVGDRVGSGWHGGHCSTCRNCRKGDFVVCENQNINGVFSNGGYAEYCLLRTEAVCSIPADLDVALAAPLLCSGVTTFNSLRNMNVLPGEIVAVQGIGGLGHLAIQFAAKMGYKVVALSSGDSKKTLAHSLGAHTFLDGSKVDQAEELTKLGGAKVILCTAPYPEVIQKLVGGLCVDGQLCILAVGGDITVPTIPMIMKRLSIKGWPSGTAQDSEETVEFALQAGIECQVDRFPLEKVNEAYKHMMDNKVRFRAVLVMDHST